MKLSSEKVFLVYNYQLRKRGWKPFPTIQLIPKETTTFRNCEIILYIGSTSLIKSPINNNKVEIAIKIRKYRELVGRMDLNHELPPLPKLIIDIIIADRDDEVKLI